MSTIRMPEAIWQRVRNHLDSTPGEHFAFLRAQCISSGGEPVFMVHDVFLVPDELVIFHGFEYELSTSAYVQAINEAVRSGDTLIELHNHRGKKPRFSLTDRDGFAEFLPYVLQRLNGKPYAATVWGDDTIYGEYFFPDGQDGLVDRITIIGDRLQQLVSKEDDDVQSSEMFRRQLLWLSPEVQKQLSRIEVGITGLGGTGGHVVQLLAYLGVRNFVLVDGDIAELDNLNRLITATRADIGKLKVDLARRLILNLAPSAVVITIASDVTSPQALDRLKGVDVLFGCVDNDGARLVLNELAVAFGLPYFDVATGIKVEDSSVARAGGRVCFVQPGGPCLNCMGEIDPIEARYFLDPPNRRIEQEERGYVEG